LVLVLALLVFDYTRLDLIYRAFSTFESSTYFKLNRQIFTVVSCSVYRPMGWLGRWICHLWLHGRESCLVDLYSLQETYLYITETVRRLC